MADLRVYKKLPDLSVKRQSNASEQDKQQMKTTVSKFFELFKAKHL